MPGPLPFLGLRAFAEVGRSGSIKAATRPLGVTPGAVSQQIKLLEARLGVALYERGGRQLRLTPAGARLLSELGDAFDRIEAALANADRRRSGPDVVVVSSTASFAASWLVPRLGRFTARHPRIEVRIVSSIELVPVGAGSGTADIAIRHGLGIWPGLDATPLIRPRLLPVGSPDLLARGPPIACPADCLHYPLLHEVDAADWRLWFESLGEDHRDPRLFLGSRFGDGVLLTRAAVAGQGLALIRDTYVSEELRAGRLVIALHAPWPASFAYYVVTRRILGRPQVERFKSWLLDEARDVGG